VYLDDTINDSDKHYLNVKHFTVWLSLKCFFLTIYIKKILLMCIFCSLFCFVSATKKQKQIEEIEI